MHNYSTGTVTPSVTTHPDYSASIAPLQVVRDCIEGEVRVKSRGEHLLPHPCAVDKTSPEQQMRYAKYLAGAEFDGFPDLTRRGWLGKMQVGKLTHKLPERLDYLVQNADGDGTPLSAAIEYAASSVMQTKYHVLVADYQGLSDADTSTLSMADVEALNPRATVKQYARESLVDYDFKRINGVMQLYYVKLLEVASELDPESGSRKNIESYLILALDEDGNYYQQKEVDGRKGERNYVSVGGSALKWLPVEVVADEECQVGSLPRGMGLLYPICSLALSRYRVSADYKEMLSALPPTVFTRGWRQGDKELFDEINGRDYMQFGSGRANNLPNNVDVKIESVSDSTGAFTSYFDNNADKVRALGGVFRDKSETQKTATEADIDASEQNAMLEMLADNLEHAFARMIAYCGMFEGLFAPDALEQQIGETVIVSLPRDFASPKLSVEEVRTLMDLIVAGVRTREHVVKALAQGGWDVQEAEQTLSDLENELPPLSMQAQQTATNTE
ncbi:MAG: DUF4055 domain-containing protein [Marinomonas gallaica]